MQDRKAAGYEGWVEEGVILFTLSLRLVLFF